MVGGWQRLWESCEFGAHAPQKRNHNHAPDVWPLLLLSAVLSLILAFLFPSLLFLLASVVPSLPLPFLPSLLIASAPFPSLEASLPSSPSFTENTDAYKAIAMRSYACLPMLLLLHA